MDSADVVIVGSGHAGAQVAISLRQKKFEGSILIIGRESEYPYERPPLSKEYLAGEKPFERIMLRPENFWEDKAIGFLRGETVVTLDPIAKQVTLDSGVQVAYGKLVWAAGGQARRLNCSGSDLDGIHYIRTKGDIDRLNEQLEAGARKAVVIGGGYIGLEAAAVLRKLEREVTLLEALPRVLARVAGPELSLYFENLHRAHGVDLQCNVMVEAILGEDSKITGVLTAEGEQIDCDLVIAGIGLIPEVDVLEQAGADCPNGVLVDEVCRTNLPDVYAIGDCAAHSNSYAGGDCIRLESVQNANDMANVVAEDILGNSVPYYKIPWFWSNQYDTRLQTVGLLGGYDTAVVRGNTEGEAFSIVYLKEGRAIALDCVNSTRDYVQGRALVEKGLNVCAETISDPTISLSEIVKTAPEAIVSD